MGKGWDSGPTLQGGGGSTGNYSRPSPPPQSNAGPIASVSPPPPDINTYLGHDTTYLGQVRGYQKALADYLAQETTQRGKITEDYGSATKALGEQKGLDLNNMLQDYASRGLANSGLYAGA